MSRILYYHDERLNVYHGDDIALGKFFQIFDNEFICDSAEGEGLVLDWSEYGYEINYTGIPEKDNVKELVDEYIKEHTIDPEKVIIVPPILFKYDI